MDDGFHGAGLYEVREEPKIVVLLCGDEPQQPLAYERRQHQRPRYAPDAASPLASAFAADDDEGSARGEGAAEPVQRPVSGDIEDEVVAAGAVRRVLAGVVDDLVRAEERTMSVPAVLQTPVTCVPKALASWTAKLPTPPDAPMTRTRWPGPHASGVPQGLQGGTPGTGYRSHRREVQAGRLRRERSCLAHAYSAKAPSQVPYTSSPGRKRLTSGPTASTTPAASMPRTRGFDPRRP